MTDGTDELGGDELERACALLAAEARQPAPSSLRHRIAGSVARTGRYGRFADRVARLFALPLARAEELLRLVEDPANVPALGFHVGSGPAPVEQGRGFSPAAPPQRGSFAPPCPPSIALLMLDPGPGLAGSHAALGRLLPGARFPRHTHADDELTLVLDGALRDEDGTEVRRGEELWKPAGSSHDFVVLDEGICVAAVLARGGVSFG